MKEKILELKASGLSYRKIADTLNVPISTVSYYACPTYRSKSKVRKKKFYGGIKERLVASKGGKCEKCGYNKCLAALEFHHTDPSKKDFQISKHIRIPEMLEKELEKCILLCSNCHRELHYSENGSD